jgi:glycosyltransferase involved in cell wall biosynthesis
MKICHVINIGFEAGGAEKSVRLIAEGMRRRGHDVHIIATDHRLDEGVPFADVIVPSITGNSLRRLSGFFWHQKAYRQVKDALTTMRPDIVHLHTHGEFSPSVLPATAAVPRVLTVHGPEDWTLKLLTWNLPSRRAGADRLDMADLARYAYLRFLQRPAYLPRLRRLDRVLVPSRFFADVLRCDLGSVPTYVLPNGIELPPSAPVPDTSQLLYVGRLEPIKGVRILIEAFGHIAPRRPEATLTLVGNGTQRSELEALVSRLGLTERVCFAGWCRTDAIRAHYEDALAVVIPSICPENFPTVALEALGVGRALVGTRVGGIPELITDGDNGLLVPPGDISSLATALDAVLGDVKRTKAWGAQSARMATNYSLDVFLDRLETHYRDVINSRADVRVLNRVGS